MAEIDHVTMEKIQNCLGVLARFAQVRAVYLFGSRADGTADEYSDIDLAVFIEDLQEWDLERRIRTIVIVQKEAGDDIEIHFFSSESLTKPQPASFAKFVTKKGIRIPFEGA